MGARPPRADPPLPQAGEAPGVAVRELLSSDGAALDLTGYWVSVVSEDWKFRMVTPKKGVYDSLMLNAGSASELASSSRAILPT